MDCCCPCSRVLGDGILVYDVMEPHEEDVETPSSSCRCCRSLEAPNRLTVPSLEVVLMMILHLCKKIVYGLDSSYRVCMYVLGVLTISVLSDYTPTENKHRNYFEDPDNFLNQWFAKRAWLWTGVLLITFIYLTSNAYTIRNNMSRIVIALLVWYSVTSIFDLVKTKTADCEVQSKESCRGIDISGHCFLLILCNLVMYEEGQAYLDLEKVEEEHELSGLKNEVRTESLKATPVIRSLFCLMAVLMLFWDFMLLITVLYFHLVIEKVTATITAVLVWIVLYKVLYRLGLSPDLPREDVHYSVIREKEDVPYNVLGEKEDVLQYTVLAEEDDAGFTDWESTDRYIEKRFQPTCIKCLR